MEGDYANLRQERGKLQQSPRDSHSYDCIAATVRCAPMDDGSAVGTNATKVSKPKCPYKMIVVAVVTSLLISAIVTAVCVVVVYHVILSKMADSLEQTHHQLQQQDNSTKMGQESSMRDLLEEIRVLKHNVSELTEENTILAGHVADYAGMAMNLSDDLATKQYLYQARCNITCASIRDPVAFVAYLSGGDQDPTVGKPIVFNTVVQNYGHAYNPTNGIFTPPVSGLYHFSVQVCMSEQDRVGVQIASSDLVYATSTFQEDYDATCYSVSTAAVLREHEAVKVDCLHSEDKNDKQPAIEGDTVDKYRTMFTGFLVHATA